MGIIVFALLVIVSLAFSAMIAAYGTLSKSHLRHWAKQHDKAAEKLYPLKARGSAALLTLELFRTISLAASATYLAVTLSPWLAGLLMTLLLFGVFVILAQIYLKPIGMQLLVWFSTPILSVTHFLRPVMLPLGRTIDNFLAGEPTTLTRSDLRKKLKSVLPDDTDLSEREIIMLSQVLSFNKKTVHDLMQPKYKLNMIGINEILTPVILDELHKSNQDFFPVMNENHKTVIGLLAMQDVMDINKSPSVKEIMKKVYFVNEEQPLLSVIDQFYQTKQPVFAAVNGAEEIVGLISIDSVLKELAGETSAPEEAKETIDDAASIDENNDAIEPAENPSDTSEAEQIAEPEPSVIE